MPGGQNQMIFNACCNCTLYRCTIYENEVEFDMKGFLNMSMVLYVKGLYGVTRLTAGCSVSENQS